MTQNRWPNAGMAHSAADKLTAEGEPHEMVFRPRWFGDPRGFTVQAIRKEVA